MDLQALFKRKTTSPAAPVAEDPVQEARTRARRRLVGAALLLVAGVVAFPLLFETQPRPVALNTPIQVAGREAPAPSVPGAASRSAAKAPAASAPAEAVAPIEPEPPATATSDAGGVAGSALATGPSATAAATAAAAPAATAVASAAAAKAPRVETIRPAAGAAPAVSPATPAAAPPPVRPASAGALAGAATAAASEPAASAPKGRRYVVQVGAFADASTAREVRLKVEKLGLKTYTQVVDVDGSKRTRVRVGPYERREEAQKTAERLKAAGLASSTVLAL